jgi:hypothetical protein
MLTDKHFIEAIKILLHSIDDIILSEKFNYTTRILLINLLSEMCKKFFIYPELISSMKVKIIAVDAEFDEILFFSMLLNLFKTDQLIKEYENKKLVKFD